MLNKPQSIHINPDNPFEHDKLNRKSSADLLTNLLTTTNGPFVLSLTSSYGRGKTTFIQMWRELLNEKAPTLYFDAWSTDFSDDPLLSFIGEIQSQIDSHKLSFNDASKAKEVFDKVAKSGTKIVKTFTPLGVKLLTLGTLNGVEDLKDIFDFDPSSDESIAGFLSKLSSDKLDEYKTQKEGLITFRENLEEFSASLRSDEHNLPLTIFVDELDRCKPTYTIELLETIKHIFSVPGVVFVLAIDREQLENSLRSVYGSDLDTNGYLARFIDLEYMLPIPDNDKLIEFLHESNEIQKILTDKSYSIDDSNQAFVTILNLVNSLAIPIRLTEQCYVNLKIILSTLPIKNTSGISMIYLSYLLVLKLFNKTLYKDNTIDSSELIKSLITSKKINKKSLSKFLSYDPYGRALTLFCKYSSSPHQNTDRRFTQLRDKATLTESDSIEFQVLAEIKTSLTEDFHIKTKQAIEMSEKFII